MIYYFLMINGELKKLSEFISIKSDISVIRKEICRRESISEDVMVLLACGGVFIEDGILEDYNCGEDNNPIYVFIKQSAKANVRIASEFVVVGECIKLEELLIQIDTLLGRKRIELHPKQWLNEVEYISIKLVELAQQLQCNKIEPGINAQHLLINGWATALANLTDSVSRAEQILNSATVLIDKFKNEFNTENDPRKVLSEARENKSREILRKIPLPLDSTSNLLEWINQRDNETFPASSINSMILQARSSLEELLGTTLSKSIEISYPGLETGFLSQIEACMQKGIKLVEYGKPREDNEDTIREKSSATKKSRTDMGSLCKRLENLGLKQVDGSKLLQDLQTYRDFMGNIVQKVNSNMPAILEDHAVSAEKHLEKAKSHIKELSDIARIVAESHEAVLKNVSDNVKWLGSFETQLTTNDNTIFLGRQKIRQVRAGVAAILQLESTPQLFLKSIVALSQHVTALQTWTVWGYSCSQVGESIRNEHRERTQEICESLTSHFLEALFQPMLNCNLPKFGYKLLSAHEDLQKTLSSLPVDKLTVAYFKDLVNQVRNLKDTTTGVQNLQSFTLDLLERPDELIARHYRTNRIEYPIEAFLDPDQETISPALSLSPTDIISLIPPPQDDFDEEVNKVAKNEAGDIPAENDRDNNDDDDDSHSSKLFQSINSTDFQNYSDRCIQTENKNAQQNNMIISMVRTMNQDLMLLRESVNEVKTGATNKLQQAESEVESHLKSVIEIFSKFEDQLVLEETNKVPLTTSMDISTNTSDLQNSLQTAIDSSTLTTPTTSLYPGCGRKVGLVLKDFEKNDPVLFQSFHPSLSSSSTKYANRHQWIMLSSDGRFYFLHDDCFPLTAKTPTRHHSNSYSQGNQSKHEESCSVVMKTSYTATSTEIKARSSDDTLVVPQSPNKSDSSPATPVMTCPPGCIIRHVVSGTYEYKEEYICKKKTNRYGLPENTRFFRVRASVDWSSTEPTLGGSIEVADKPIRIKNQSAK